MKKKKKKKLSNSLNYQNDALLLLVVVFRLFVCLFVCFCFICLYMFCFYLKLRYPESSCNMSIKEPSYFTPSLSVTLMM